ncbi:ATP-binding cassette domain-containing protein [Roseomonas terrae]|jgi:ABC-type protease/lipase transport system fused ATPase/permease subunit|uniref:ATP-binding cassette domain-containing protein n=1 Tax=Neoroseomonas terrae TaxID=424799 RepID=A0ABS5EGR6_9PROT|nr:ATP-binding cassette domain-containing protein [Neoroseomonas terrae]MBR0650223.1 ATP-binding cassette domain-containing protein [Neoroseomonas terrae]
MASSAMAGLSAEMARTARAAAWLGLAGALGPFALVMLTVQFYALVVPTGSLSTAAGLSAGFAVVAVAVVGLGQIRERLLLAGSERLVRRLTARALPAATARAALPAMATDQALRDIETVRRGVAGPLSAVALDAALVPALLALLAVFHWAFALFAVVAAALALLLGLAAERATRAALVDANNASAQGARLVADAARCAEAVEAMGMLPALVSRWAGAMARGATGLRRAQGTARLAQSATATLYGVAQGGAITVGVIVLAGGSTIGYGILAGMLLTARVMDPFSRIGGQFEDAAAARAAWRRLDLLLTADETGPAAATRAFPCPDGRLLVERVTLVFPGAARPLLRDVNLVMGPGDVVALAGPPGTGKSSLLRVVLGIQPCNAGEVFLDGHATAQWDRADLARHMGYLPQEPLLPEATVAESIARLDTAPDMAAVIAAARLAGAIDMIVGLPNGFATRIGGRMALSMGQRQRIALARAVYGTPRLVLLDEPAAYLDAEGEAAVMAMILALSAAGTGVIFTSHREGLLRAAARVMTLHEGRLEDAGERRRLLSAPRAPRTLPQPARRLPAPVAA